MSDEARHAVIGLALAPVDAQIVLLALEAFNFEYATDDERDRASRIMTALRAELREQ